VLQKSFCVAPRKRAQNTIPGDDLMANEDSLDEPRCRMGFYPSCLLSDIRSTFATKSALIGPSEDTERRSALWGRADVYGAVMLRPSLTQLGSAVLRVGTPKADIILDALTAPAVAPMQARSRLCLLARAYPVAAQGQPHQFHPGEADGGLLPESAQCRAAIWMGTLRRSLSDRR
jgi:hypothetical protein